MDSWRRYLAIAHFDDRGARIEWKALNVRVDGQVQQAIGMNAPDWVAKRLKPHLRERNARRIRLRNGDDEWLEVYILPDGLDAQLKRLLELLSSVCSIGRMPDPVDACIALDLYKIPEDGVDPGNWANTEAGELVNRSKYRSDRTAFETLADRLVVVVTDHPDYRSAGLVVSVPGRHAAAKSHGERLAERVAERANLPFWRAQPSYRSRPPAKEGFELEAEHVSIQADLRGLTVVIVDDVIRSGRSMAAVATRAKDQGATSVLGLVGAKTLRN